MFSWTFLIFPGKKKKEQFVRLGLTIHDMFTGGEAGGGHLYKQKTHVGLKWAFKQCTSPPLPYKAKIKQTTLVLLAPINNASN